jgi:hypothetical protein
LLLRHGPEREPEVVSGRTAALLGTTTYTSNFAADLLQVQQYTIVGTIADCSWHPPRVDGDFKVMYCPARLLVDSIPLRLYFSRRKNQTKGNGHEMEDPCYHRDRRGTGDQRLRLRGSRLSNPRR